MCGTLDLLFGQRYARVSSIIVIVKQVRIKECTDEPLSVYGTSSAPVWHKDNDAAQNRVFYGKRSGTVMGLQMDPCLCESACQFLEDWVSSCMVTFVTHWIW